MLGEEFQVFKISLVALDASSVFSGDTMARKPVNYTRLGERIAKVEDEAQNFGHLTDYNFSFLDFRRRER